MTPSETYTLVLVAHDVFGIIATRSTIFATAKIMGKEKQIYRIGRPSRRVKAFEKRSPNEKFKHKDLN